MFVWRHDLRSERHCVEDLQAQVHLVSGERSYEMAHVQKRTTPCQLRRDDQSQIDSDVPTSFPLQYAACRSCPIGSRSGPKPVPVYMRCLTWDIMTTVGMDPKAWTIRRATCVYSPLLNEGMRLPLVYVPHLAASRSSCRSTQRCW